MAEQDNKQIDRRKFMRLAGVGLVTTSLGGLAACGDSGSSSAPAPKAAAPAPKRAPIEPAPTPEPAATAPVAESPAPASPAPAAPAAGRVPEDDPIAQSLGYKHNAAEVDLAKHPKRGEASAANQYCKNCILFQGGADDEWGGCSIFGGRQVNANGWCATYAPKG